MKKYMLRERGDGEGTEGGGGGQGGSSGLTAKAIYQRSQKFTMWNLFRPPVGLLSPWSM